MTIATWNIPWHTSKKFNITFKTAVDSEYTSHEQREKLKSDPRYFWTIRVQKTMENYHLLKAFFEARDGKFNAFYWKWDSTIDEMGDDVTYLVRFDIDEMDFDDDGHFWLIPFARLVSAE